LIKARSINEDKRTAIGTFNSDGFDIGGKRCQAIANGAAVLTGSIIDELHTLSTGAR
jgi:hypothetical protein